MVASMVVVLISFSMVKSRTLRSQIAGGVN